MFALRRYFSLLTDLAVYGQNPLEATFLNMCPNTVYAMFNRGFLYYVIAMQNNSAQKPHCKKPAFIAGGYLPHRRLHKFRRIRRHLSVRFTVEKAVFALSLSTPRWWHNVSHGEQRPASTRFSQAIRRTSALNPAVFAQ